MIRALTSAFRWRARRRTEIAHVTIPNTCDCTQTNSRPVIVDDDD